jgi:hypothetical protein
MLYASIAERNTIRKQEGKSEDFSYIWHVSYYLTRYMNRYKSNDEVYSFCRQLRDKDIDYKNGRNLEGYFAIDVKSRREQWRIIIQPLDGSKNPFTPCYIDQIAEYVRIVEITEVSKHYE